MATTPSTWTIDPERSTIRYQASQTQPRVGLAASASANPSSFMVAGVGFEPTTFGL
jgi:hypothetical protein